MNKIAILIYYGKKQVLLQNIFQSTNCFILNRLIRKLTKRKTEVQNEMTLFLKRKGGSSENWSRSFLNCFMVNWNIDLFLFSAYILASFPDSQSAAESFVNLFPSARLQDCRSIIISLPCYFDTKSRVQIHVGWEYSHSYNLIMIRIDPPRWKLF